METKPVKKGLTGWLLLVGLGVVLSPIRLLIQVIPVYFPIFRDGSWQALTTPGSPYYHPLWGPLLLGEIIYNIAQLIVLVFIVYLFFSKDYLFPKFYVGVSLVTILFIPLDALLVKQILPEIPLFGPTTTAEFTRAIVSGLIWIPYMLFSKQVKATFVENKPGEESLELQETLA